MFKKEEDPKTIHERYNALKDPYAYRGKAIQIQIAAYNAKYATEKFEQSCNALIVTPICNRDCKNCPLQKAHERALQDIAAGLRHRPETDERKSYGAYRFMSTNKNGETRTTGCWYSDDQNLITRRIKTRRIKKRIKP